MKQNHIYLGGTILLVVLGASGGYYLWAGPEETKERPQTNSERRSANRDDAEAIEVPPITPDLAATLQELGDLQASADRYAANPSYLETDAAQVPPGAGGASALPAARDGQSTAAAGQPPSLPAGNPYGLPAAHDLGSTKQLPVEPEQAAVESLDAADATGLPGGRLVTRGQEPNSIAPPPDANDLANPLRADARAAFASDADPQEQALEPVASRYGGEDAPNDAAESPAGNASTGLPYSDIPIGPLPQGPEVAVQDQGATSTDQSLSGPAAIASPPAPITVAADRAQPLNSASSDEQLPYETSEANVPSEGYREMPEAAGDGQSPTYEPAYAADEPTGNQLPRDPIYPSSPGNVLTDAAPSPYRGSNISGEGTSRSIAAAPLAVVGETPYASSSQGNGRPGEAGLEGPQAPQLAIEKIAPAEIQVNKACKFQVIVRNVGRVVARDVRLFDEIPLGTRLEATSPQAATSEGRLLWKLGDMAPGDEQAVEIDLLPIQEGEIGSVATVQFAADASARTQCTQPRLEVKTDMARSVMIGQQQVLRITLENPGTGDATGVMLLETVPEGMSHPHGDALEFEVGTLRAGETRELELVLTAEQRGVVQNRIVATADANLRAEHVAEFEVVAAEIALTVDGPALKYLELPATFTVAIQNTGTAAAKDVELVGKLPEGMKFVSADNFGQYDEQTHSVYWSLAELPPREMGQVELVALPVELGEHRLQVKADAESGLTDQAESTLQVEGLAAIKFEVTDIADPIEVGGETSYEIRVVNQGSKSATNVIVIAQLPEGMQAVRAQGETPEQIQPGQVVFAPLTELSPKADTTYRVDVKGLHPGDQRILVQVTAHELEQPIKEEESTRVYADQ
jgi:uncharacterized repeat protein (TIGR01451 family)